MITDEDVKIAIAVLSAFALGTLSVSDELAVDLLDAAADALQAPGVTYAICKPSSD